MHGDRHTLRLVGELDVATAPKLQQRIRSLCEQGAKEIVLDLHDLSFLDSSGLRLILSSRELCERHGCDFSLTRMPASMQQLVELTGVLDRLSFRGKSRARRMTGRQAARSRMPPRRLPPGFQVSVDFNRDAPRSARNYLRNLIHAQGSDDVRDASVLLTSELVTLIVERGTAAFTESGRLCVWLQDDVARVELRVPSGLLSPPREQRSPRFDAMLLDELADRWAIDDDGETSCVWFEIDRGRLQDDEPRGVPGASGNGHRSHGAR